MSGHCQPAAPLRDLKTAISAPCRNTCRRNTCRVAKRWSSRRRRLARACRRSQNECAGRRKFLAAARRTKRLAINILLVFWPAGTERLANRFRLFGNGAPAASLSRHCAGSVAAHHIQCPPVRHVNCHQCLEQAPMVRHPQMQQFMSHNEVLKMPVLLNQVSS